MADAKTIWVRPADGLKYRYPGTRQLVPQAGFAAPADDLNVQRSLRWGSLVLAEPPAEAEAPPADPPAAEAAAAKPPAAKAKAATVPTA